MIYITTDTSFDMPKDVFQSLTNVAVQKIIVRLICSKNFVKEKLSQQAQ